MAVQIGSPPNRAEDRPTRGKRFEFTAHGAATVGTGQYHQYSSARINGAFAGGAGGDANSVTIEHSWDGSSWAGAGNATVAGNVAAQAVVSGLRPHVRVVIAAAGAATFTGTVDLI